MSMEIWKDIPGYEGLYQVSNLGRVKSLCRKSGEMTQHIKKGYCVVYLYKNKMTRTLSVHRLVASAFIPNPDNKPQIDHIDRNRTNNDTSNLRWATASENCINKKFPTSKLGEKYIHPSYTPDTYIVRIRRLNISKYFTELNDAISFRDQIISTL